MRDVVSWGLYIFTFAFFVKLSAGGLIVASSAEIFGIAALRPLARLGVLTASVSISMAGITIIPDLGRPGRMMNLFLHPNWRSPMLWDVTIVGVYFLLATSELWLMSSTHVPWKEQWMRRLAFVGLPAAFALHSITAWIFGLQVSRALWNTALMAPLFVVSAILSGTALIAVIAGVLQRYADFKLHPSTWQKLGGLMAISLAIDLFFLFSEYVTILWAGVPREMIALKMILPGGSQSLLFWLEWVLGGVVPFVLLVSPRTRFHVSALVASGVLILVGVYAFQIELATVGMANPLIQMAPGTSLGTYTAGTSIFQLTGHYSPTWVEYSILLGLLSVFSLLLALGYRVLRIDLDQAAASVSSSHECQTAGTA
jgi:molybdopterin-containing oxidoreductase family membrane subunit